MQLSSNPFTVSGIDTLYVKYLESLGSGNGTALMRAAFQESLVRGYEGAIALHSADTPYAIEFYQKFPGYIFDPTSNLFYWSAEAAKKAFGP